MKTNLILPKLLLGTMLLIIVTGCSGITAETEHTAILTIQENSPHAETFTELGLGYLLNYNLELKEADRLWVKLWIEGYEDGQPIRSDSIIELSYGQHPEALYDGPLRWAILKLETDKVAMSLQSGGAKVTKTLDPALFESISGGFQTWDYAWPTDEAMTMEPSDTRVLGAIRNGTTFIQPYDLREDAEVARMIAEEKQVFFLKMNLAYIDNSNNN